MMRMEDGRVVLEGPKGTLVGPENDELMTKLAMLYDGECTGMSRLAAARKYGYSKQRYFQLRKLYQSKGSQALINQKRGPKDNYRRTDAVVQLVIRHLFLDPSASADVIAQKLRQTGHTISARTVNRVVEDYGLQKKTLSTGSRPRGAGRDPAHPDAGANRAVRRKDR